MVGLSTYAVLCVQNIYQQLPVGFPGKSPHMINRYDLPDECHHQAKSSTCTQEILICIGQLSIKYTENIHVPQSMNPFHCTHEVPAFSSFLFTQNIL